MTACRLTSPSRMLPLVALMGLTACDGDNDNGPGPASATAAFEVTVTNLTAAQPLSPPATILHTADFQAFSLGQSASTAVEALAEAGDNAGLVMAAGDSDATLAVEAGTMPIPPGSSASFTLETEETNLGGARLTLLTMLVNTNDAFGGLNGIPLPDLATGEARVAYAVAYDAGTEDDTETAGTIPGPAGGGEGFNAERDDAQDFITMHAGVVSRDDGLPGSDLTQDHRFDNPVARIEIRRVN